MTILFFFCLFRSYYHYFTLRKMVADAKKQFAVTLCNCGGVFQGDRFKRHQQAFQQRGHHGHAKEEQVHYCSKCNTWAGEMEVFAHPQCPRISFPKPELKLILKRVAPPSRERLLEAALSKERNKASDEAKAAVAAISKEDVPLNWENAFGAPLSDDSLEDPAPKKKRVRRLTDLDSSTSTSSEEPSPPLKTSTPTKHATIPSPSPPSSSTTAHLPRKDAQHISTTYNHNKLKGEVNRLKNTIASLNTELGIYKGKECLNKRLTEELQAKKEKVRELETALTKASEERQKIADTSKTERERWEEEKRRLSKAAEEMEAKSQSVMAKERELWKEEKRRMEKDFDAYLTKLKEQWAKEKSRLEKRDEKEKDHVLIHVELKDGKARRRRAEMSLDESIQCFNNEAEQARCLHIEVTGYETFTKVRNMRWPSGKSKLVKDYL